MQDNALAVGADEEPMAGGLPAAVMADRVGLAVDDVDRRAAQPPPSGRGHHLVQLIDVPRREGAPPTRVESMPVGGAEAELHRPQRAAGGGIDGQGGAQLVARVGVVGPDVAVALRAVLVEVEHAPVVDDQDEPAGGLGQGGADGVLGGLDEGMEGDVLVVEEAAHGPRGGEGPGGPRQGGQPRHDGVDRVRMLAHELPVSILVTAVQVAEMIAMPIETTQVEKLCPYPCPTGEGPSPDRPAAGPACAP